MKKQILILCSVITIIFILYKLVYKPFAWQYAIQTKEHKLQVGSFIFSYNKISNTDTFTSNNHYFVRIVTDIDDDYVRLTTIKKLYLPNQKMQSLPSNNDNYYDNLKSTITNKRITEVNIDYGLINEFFTKEYFLLKHYPMLHEFPFYYEIGFANKSKPITENGTVDFQYFENVYSKKEIIENAKLVRYTLTNQTNNLPVKYNLGKKLT